MDERYGVQEVGGGFAVHPFINGIKKSQAENGEIVIRDSPPTDFQKQS